MIAVANPPADAETLVAALQQCRAQERHDASIRLANTLFQLHWQRTQYNEALAFAELALELARRAENLPWQHTILLGLFMVRFDVGDLRGADVALREAAKVAPHGDRGAQADLRSYEGVLRVSRGELAGARSAFLDILASAPPGHPARSDARFNLIEVCLALGRLAEAEQHLDAILAEHDAPQPDRRSYQIAKAHHHGLVAEAKGELETAELELRRGLTLAHEDPDEVPIDWIWELEHGLGRVLAARGDSVGAMVALERAIMAVEALRSGFSHDDLKDWLLTSKRAPYELLFELQLESDEIMAGLHTMERTAARAFMEAFVETASLRESATATEVAARVRALAGIARGLGRSSAFDLADIAWTLGMLEHRHVIVFFRARQRWWRVTVAAGQVEASLLPIEHDALERQVAGMLADPDATHFAAALGDALLSGGALGAAGGTIHIVTDGVLAELPFAALIVNGRRLITNHAIVHAPSLTWLASHESREALGSAVVIGDPKENLPAAAKEAAEVAALLGVNPRRGPLGSTLALEQANDAAVLHVAAHAGQDAAGAWLELADARVYAGQILEAGVRPRLVVLATCVSGTRSGGRMWGSLGAAFLASGSQAVLATLWSVDDAATRRFVSYFYREGGAHEPAAALARAQRELASAGEPASTWAPFVLLGSG